MFYIVWADNWYMPKETNSGNSSPHDGICAPLTWICNNGTLPEDAPPPPKSHHLREAEDYFIHISKYVVPPRFQALLFTKNQANS